MGSRELCGGVHTDTFTDKDAIGFQIHCVGVGASVGKGKICVGVGSVNTPFAKVKMQCANYFEWRQWSKKISLSRSLSLCIYI